MYLPYPLIICPVISAISGFEITRIYICNLKNLIPSAILPSLSTLPLSGHGKPQSLATQLSCVLSEQLITANVVTEVNGSCFQARSQCVNWKKENNSDPCLYLKYEREVEAHFLNKMTWPLEMPSCIFVQREHRINRLLRQGTDR